MQLVTRSHGASSQLARPQIRRVTISQAANSSAAAHVQEKVKQALQQVQDAQEQILQKRQEGQEEADQRQKEQRYERVKGALELKEKGHNLDPSAGHAPTDDLQSNSKEAQTQENANSADAQVPNPSISKSVRQRLLAMEELRAAKPFRRLISRGEPVPQLTHHYAAAAWWAVS